MFSRLITRATLKKFAGSRSFQRGEEYFADGAVERLRATDRKITANVDGTDTYWVELRNDDDELDYDCTCPYATGGNFCKHCVAVGLAWLAQHASEKKSIKSVSCRGKRRDPWSQIRDYLASQPREELLELLLDVAQRDDRLYQALELKAELSSGSGPVNAVKTFRRAITEATRTRGFIDWGGVETFAGNLDRVVDALEEMFVPATAAALIELAEYGIERTEKALEQIDDSSGGIGGIVMRLGELHFKACRMARPDSKGLATRLFRLETTLPFGLCRFDPLTYREVLGKEGMARYRELAETEWRKIKPRRKGDDLFDGHRFRITSLMEKLAEADGDTEKLVEIKSHDLSSSYRYLEIAEILKKAKQPDQALSWAERGLQAFAERPDSRLRDFLVDAYLKQQRSDEALQLTWVQFEERPALEAYKKLQRVAGKLGIWPEQRERALNRVEEAIASRAAKISHWQKKAAQPNYSLRLEIALWEKDLDAAWTAAQRGLCDRDLLVDLAGKLDASRPDDAIQLYRRVVPTIVEQTNNAAYEEGITLVKKVGKILKREDKSEEFNAYLTELRIRFKPKRNFIKLLDKIASSKR